MGRLLIWVSGASPEILKGFPADRAKYVGIGAAILITSGIAAVSMTFALITALKIALWAAIPAALAWGVAIMSLDRWLVVSLQRQTHWWGYLTLVLPRVLLGILFGLIISTPFVLQIFAPEISKQIALIERQRADAYYIHLRTDPLTLKIARDRRTVTALNNTIISGGGPVADPGRDPAVRSLEARSSTAGKQAARAFREWKCELDGVPAGACKPGDGPLAMASHRRYLHALAQQRADNAQIRRLEQRLLRGSATARGKAARTAARNLPAAKLQLQADLAEQNSLTHSFTVTNANQAGLLLRLQALNEATSQNGALSGARTVLWLFFTVIECLPVMVKVLLLLGPENAYEQALALDEATRLQAASAEALQRQASMVRQADSAAAKEDQLFKAREAAMPRVVRATVDAEQEVAMESIRAWQSTQLGEIRNRGHRYPAAARPPGMNGDMPAAEADGLPQG